MRGNSHVALLQNAEIEGRQRPMNTDLDILSATIQAHARELAGQEWEKEHRPLLMQILENSGLATQTQTGSKPEGTLSLSNREVPTEAIVKALQEQFLLSTATSNVRRRFASESNTARSRSSKPDTRCSVTGGSRSWAAPTVSTNPERSPA
jgi:hypothetical protein